MGRGIPPHDTLPRLREEKVAYLVGTPRSLLSQLEKELWIVRVKACMKG